MQSCKAVGGNHAAMRTVDSGRMCSLHSSRAAALRLAAPSALPGLPPRPTPQPSLVLEPRHQANKPQEEELVHQAGLLQEPAALQQVCRQADGRGEGSGRWGAWATDMGKQGSSSSMAKGSSNIRAAPTSASAVRTWPVAAGQLGPQGGTDEALEEAHQARHQRAGDALGRVALVPLPLRTRVWAAGWHMQQQTSRPLKPWPTAWVHLPSNTHRCRSPPPTWLSVAVPPSPSAAPHSQHPTLRCT